MEDIVVDSDLDSDVDIEKDPCLMVVPKADTSTRRFFATKRGRPEEERDRTDLLFLWKERENEKAILQKIEDFDLMERKCI